MALKFKFLSVLVLLIMAGSSAYSQKTLGNEVQCHVYDIDIDLISGDCDLGLLNPDGAKILSSNYVLVFKVQGEVKKQLFSAKGTFDWKDRNVFITNNKWYYNGYQNNNSDNWYQLPGNGNDFEKEDCKTKNDNSKKAYFKFVPGTVFAAPDATEGFYSFEVKLEVQSLTM